MKAQLTLTVNGEARDVVVAVHKTLLEVLREDLGLTGTKHGCELGECGTCTVLVDGEPVLSCLALPVELQGRDIKTVEGMADGSRLHPLQQHGSVAFGWILGAIKGFSRDGAFGQALEDQRIELAALRQVLCWIDAVAGVTGA